MEGLQAHLSISGNLIYFISIVYPDHGEHLCLGGPGIAQVLLIRVLVVMVLHISVLYTFRIVFHKEFHIVSYTFRTVYDLPFTSIF